MPEARQPVEPDTAGAKGLEKIFHRFPRTECKPFCQRVIGPPGKQCLNSSSGPRWPQALLLQCKIDYCARRKGVPQMSAPAKALKPAANVDSPVKDLYGVGEIPPLGHVPARMHAWAIRQDRHGPPDSAMQVEIVPIWPIGEDECLILVMAAGVNYNGVWAALGKPISPIDGHKNPYHIAGSDAAGVVYAVGSNVKRWKVGDEVVVHCNQDDGRSEE